MIKVTFTKARLYITIFVTQIITLLGVYIGIHYDNSIAIGTVLASYGIILVYYLGFGIKRIKKK